MKDLTVYSKYRTFIEQIIRDTNLVTYYEKSSEYMSKLITIFGTDLCKKGFTQNDAVLTFIRTYNNIRIKTTIYVPCADQYQKQFNVYVLNNIDDKVETHCAYKESVNPMCISNANIKDIINEQNNATVKE